MFSIQRNNNLLEYFLDALNIKHTRAFARKLFEEHPHRFDMYGLHSMCLIYGIKTIGVSVSTKNFNNLSYPCILHTTKDFVIATSCSSGIISYIDGGITKKESCENFKSSWTGNALIVSEFISAEEPNYSENIKNQRISDYSFYFILLSLLLVLVVGTFRNILARAYHVEMSVVTSLLGIVICAILFEKQLYGYSIHGGDKICSLIKKTNCNVILNGEHSKLFGISWSEIGLGYFISNSILLSLFPNSVSTVMIINCMAMFFALWSITYQWKIAKSWCTLCVLTQIIIWLTSIILISNFVQYIFSFEVVDSFLYGSIYPIAIMFAHTYADKISIFNKYTESIKSYQSLKSNNAVAKALIKQSVYYPVSIHDSKILFGNINARILITILSNPHCMPCAKLHEKVEQTLNNYGENICVQYIFTSFNEKYYKSCKYLIGEYDSNNLNKTRKVYSEWYKSSRGQKEEILVQVSEGIHKPSIEEEWQKHKEWYRKCHLSETPTILVNGFLLPSIYDLNDIMVLCEAFE